MYYLAQLSRHPMMLEGRRDNVWFELAWLVFWGLIILTVVYLLYRLANDHKPRSTGEADPLMIAKQRLAKGEISKVEYAEIKKELQ